MKNLGTWHSRTEQLPQDGILEMSRDERRYLEYLAKTCGMDYYDVRDNLHELKEHHGVGRRQVKFDEKTGDIYDPLSAEKVPLRSIKDEEPSTNWSRDNRNRRKKRR